MKTAYIIRDYMSQRQCLGSLVVTNDCGDVIYTAHILELAWRENKRNISCVPPGNYIIKKEWSPRFGQDLWEAYGIPNRSECKFHAGTTHKDSQGCFIIGRDRFDITGDTELDMIESRVALDMFHQSMGQSSMARLVIINDPH